MDLVEVGGEMETTWLALPLIIKVFSYSRERDDVPELYGKLYCRVSVCLASPKVGYADQEIKGLMSLKPVSESEPILGNHKSICTRREKRRERKREGGRQMEGEEKKIPKILMNSNFQKDSWTHAQGMRKVMRMHDLRLNGRCPREGRALRPSVRRPCPPPCPKGSCF